MREILFRGKSVSSGKWTQGYLFKIWEKAYICWGTVNDVPNMTEVDPETVCQYTGLKDKDDKRIYEGDILNVTYSDQQGECHCAENSILYDLRNTSVIGWLDYANELEIAGNIFDSPELIQEG